MTNVRAVHAVGTSIVTHLQQTYPGEGSGLPACEFELVSTERLATMTDSDTTRLTLFLYRISIDKNLRNARRLNPDLGPKPPLSLDLHYLLSAWAPTAEAEQVVMTWAMDRLHRTPVLNRARLDPRARWEDEDVVHLLPEELTNEDIMRIWDALEPRYRLSFSYIARAIRVDGDPGEELLPVVDSRFAWTDFPGGGR